MRVQIPAYTDQWMKGDRYGVVVSNSVIRGYSKKSSKSGIAVYRVKLDKSGQTMKFLADDCTEV